MLRRGIYAVLFSRSSISGEFCRRLRCQITYTFSAAPASRNASISDFSKWFNAGSTKRIALRITGHLCQKEPRRIGDGRKVVSIACCDLMNRSRKNGNTSAEILCALVSSSIQRTGHTSFNSTPNEFGVRRGGRPTIPKDLARKGISMLTGGLIRQRLIRELSGSSLRRLS